MRLWDLSANKPLTVLHIPQGSPVGQNPLGAWTKMRQILPSEIWYLKGKNKTDHLGR